jgi:hypothetical protein
MSPQQSLIYRAFRPRCPETSQDVRRCPGGNGEIRQTSR